MIDVLETLAERYRRPPMQISRILGALALAEFGDLVRGWLDASTGDR